MKTVFIFCVDSGLFVGFITYCTCLQDYVSSVIEKQTQTQSGSITIGNDPNSLIYNVDNKKFITVDGLTVNYYLSLYARTLKETREGKIITAFMNYSNPVVISTKAFNNVYNVDDSNKSGYDIEFEIIADSL